MHHDAAILVARLVEERAQSFEVGAQVSTQVHVRHPIDGPTNPIDECRREVAAARSRSVVERRERGTAPLQKAERMVAAVVAEGGLEKMPKKEALQFSRDLVKLQKSIGGIKTMTGLPDAIFVIDVGYHKIAITEANKLGIPLPYDYGGLRETFLTNVVTNWMGDDAWLWKLSCQHRKFVYTGDTYWLKGTVVARKQEDGRNEVHLDIWVEHQHGTIVSPGNAVVLLPTRDKAVELPRPAQEDIDGMYAHEVSRYLQPE